MDQTDHIKEAFAKAKEDIFALKEQFSSLVYELEEIKRVLEELRFLQTDLINRQSTSFSINPTQQEQNQVNTQQTNQQTNKGPPFPTDDWPYKRLKPHIYNISTGNGGVPTNKPTNQQTDRLTHNLSKIDQIEEVSKILASLDTLKKDLRHKFKNLTKQEMLVFSTLYQLQEENFTVDYSIIASKLNLSESSIRDYIQRIIQKGIPIQKNKENNKKILLSLSEDFKKIASLQTILQLREL